MNAAGLTESWPEIFYKMKTIEYVKGENMRIKNLSEIFDDVVDELESARTKFPDTTDLLHAFQEEAGEVTKAFLENKYEGLSDEEVYKEIIQTMAMSVRLIQDRDPDFPFGGKGERANKV